MEKQPIRLTLKTHPVQPAQPIQVSAVETPQKLYPQLTFSEEKIFRSSSKTDHTLKLKAIMDILVQRPPISLSPQGVNFINQLLEPPYPPTQQKNPDKIFYYKPKTSSPNKIYSLIVPVPGPPTVRITSDPSTSTSASAGQSLRFHLCRDNDHEFTNTGTSIVLIHKGERHPTNVYGVIDPERHLFYGRIQVRGRDLDQIPYGGQLSQRDLLEALSSHVVEIFHSLAVDPVGYFSTTGQQCGLCMICGRELSDETSKQRGMGPICAQLIRTIQVTLECGSQQRHLGLDS